MSNIIIEQFEEKKQEIADVMIVIKKYINAAKDALHVEYGDDFTAEDVKNLARLMFGHDLNVLMKDADLKSDKLSKQEEAVIQQYTQAAQAALEAEYGDNYTANDIEELAMLMIERDAEISENDEDFNPSPEEIEVIETYIDVSEKILYSLYEDKFSDEDVKELVMVLIKHDARIAEEENGGNGQRHAVNKAELVFKKFSNIAIN